MDESRKQLEDGALARDSLDKKGSVRRPTTKDEFFLKVSRKPILSAEEKAAKSQKLTSKSLGKREATGNV